MVNSVILVGRLTKKPEVKYGQGPNGTAYCWFGLAVDRSYAKKNADGSRPVDFIDMTIFGRSAEVLAQYGEKGQIISVEGTIQQDRYANDMGETRSRLRVIANRFTFIGGRPSNQNGGNRGYNNGYNNGNGSYNNGNNGYSGNGNGNSGNNRNSGNNGYNGNGSNGNNGYNTQTNSGSGANQERPDLSHPQTYSQSTNPSDDPFPDYSVNAMPKDTNSSTNTDDNGQSQSDTSYADPSDADGLPF